MLPAVLEKGLRDLNSPMYTLSQNGYGDRRVKARKCTCCLPLDKITALHVQRASRRIGFGASMQDEKLPPTVFDKNPAWPQEPNLYLEPKWLRSPAGQGKEAHRFFATG
jgi:hypothetical protein